MSTATPKRDPWKTTAIRLAPSQVYVMAVMRDSEFPFQPHTHTEGRALDVCIARGWVGVDHLAGGPYHLTEVGKHLAEVCCFAIGRAASAKP